MNHKSVYIIIVNYNGLKETIELLNCLSDIEWNNLHIVIIDNASPDGDAEHLAKLSNIKLILAEKNVGFSAGNNLGIQYALGNGADYIVLINNDTIVKKDFLIYAINDLEHDSQIGIVTGKIMYYTEKNKFWFAGGRLSRKKGRAYHFGSNEVDCGQYDKKKEINFCTGCLMIIPKEVVEKVGFMEEKYFLYFEDTEFSTRMQNYGYKILYDPLIKIYHKIGSSMKNGSDLYNYYNWRNRLYFIRDCLNINEKVCAYLYFIYEAIKRLIKKELKLKILRRAIFDFCNDISGKTF